MGVAERVQKIIEPVLAALGLELYDLEHGGGSVRVTVDRDGGLDAELLTQATRLISRELDRTDPIPSESPATAPVKTITNTSLVTPLAMLPALAPIAMRMPISRRR